MWVLPTLSRPAQCVKVIENLIAHKMTTAGVVFVNDPGMDVEGIKKVLPDNWELYVNDRNAGALGALDFIFKERPGEKFYGFIADDEFVQTDYWDLELIEACGDWNIAHGDEGRDIEGRLQGFACVGGELARCVGYLTIPETWHFFGFDNMWGEIALKGGCRSLFVRNVKIEHRHHYFGLAERDECYALGESRKDIDYQVYANWLRTALPSVVSRVKTAREVGIKLKTG